MSKNRNNDSRPNRDLILESALDEFSIHGFAGARINSIATRAGLNVRMVYHYFGSKEGLYQAALAHVLETIQDTIAHVPVIRMTIDHETMMDLFSRFYNLMFSEPRTARLLVAECLDGGKRLVELKKTRPELFEPILDKAVAIFRSLIGSHRKPGDDDPFWLLGIAGLVSFLVTGYHTTTLFLGQEVNSPERWEDAIARLINNAITSEVAPEKVATKKTKQKKRNHPKE